MTRDLQRFFRTLEVMRPQLATIANAIDLLNTSGVSDAIREMQRRRDEVSRSLALADSVARRADLFRASQTLNEMVAQTSATLDSFNRVHPSWLSALRDVAIPSTQLPHVAKLALCDISRNVETSRLLWSGIDYEELGRGPQGPTISNDRLCRTPCLSSQLPTVI